MHDFHECECRIVICFFTYHQCIVGIQKDPGQIKWFCLEILKSDSTSKVELEMTIRKSLGNEPYDVSIMKECSEMYNKDLWKLLIQKTST